MSQPVPSIDVALLLTAHPAPWEARRDGRWWEVRDARGNMIWSGCARHAEAVARTIAASVSLLAKGGGG